MSVQMEVVEGNSAGDTDQLDRQSDHEDQDRHSEHSDHDQNAADLEGSKSLLQLTGSLDTIAGGWNYSYILYCFFCLQCFDTVGWAAGRASWL